jgi:hypothetical protein
MSGTYRLTIELPAVVKNLLPNLEQEAKRLIAAKLYLDESVSVGRAAEIAGMGIVTIQSPAGDSENRRNEGAFSQGTSVPGFSLK